MRLVDKETGRKVGVRSIVVFNGMLCTISHMPKPSSPASSGKVTISLPDGTQREYFAGVVGLVWVDREDRTEGAVVIETS